MAHKTPTCLCYSGCSWNWSITFFPVSSSLTIFSATWVSTTSFVSNAYNSEDSSSNGFPISARIARGRLTFWRKSFCVACASSWCFDFLIGEIPQTEEHSSTSLLTSGPATIHRLRADGFSVKSIASPLTLTTVLFCSWAWSIAMLEKGSQFFGQRSFQWKIPNK